MSHATLRENIKTRIEHADLATLQSIWEIFNHSERRTIATPEPAVGSAPNRADQTTVLGRPLQFVGENLTLEEFERLSPEERAMLKWRLKEKNQTWLQEKFATLNAAWLVVVDGEVVDSGKHLQTKPLPPQLLEIHRQTKKFPLVFVNDKLIVIEESASAWQSTILANDFYPTLPIIFNSAAGTAEMIGDFDTGCSHTFVDYDFLAYHRIIQPETVEDFEKHKHLNQDFVYVNKPVRVELPVISNEVRAVDTQISCVRKWYASPFVEINPNRRALLGRDVLLQLKPQVLLDFAKLQTEIMTAKSAKPARRSKASQKRSAAAKRRRA